MGTSIQAISDQVTLIASESTWIEGSAIQQLQKTATLPGMLQVAGMPDLHPGKGYPIGAAFFSENTLYPALVGNDIGCGMALWQTDLKVRKANPDKLAKRLHNIENPLCESWQPLVQQRQQDKQLHAGLYDRSLGTIGGGNHFAEFQCFDEIIDEVRFHSAGFDKNQLQLLVHSGSRGLGQSILVKHIQQFNHNGLNDHTDAQTQYLTEHDHAVRWAELNREMIARRFLSAIKTEGECLTDVNHNLVIPKSITLGFNTGSAETKQGWLHRKGATPSDAGLVVIPGSRGDHSYLVEPTNSEAALFSLAHGAGRKWKRGDCKARLSHKYKREDLLKTTFGSRVICGNKELLYDEAPQAYKDCASIIADLASAGLLNVVARLKPVLTFKTQGEC